ncbi:MAG: M23 family metallopeptidase [Candidatus Moranbacteria bacterium]|nr:M23 family metallopeptidase [Candidatus Moranbacteria bacterium]
MVNPRLIIAFWFFRKELKYVALTFLIILSLPIIAVVILTNSGINIISDKIATSNIETNNIEIKNPVTGEVVKTISPSISWPTTGVITLEFGKRSPYQLYHTGLDIANIVGTDIIPLYEGTVTYAGEISWGFGKHIIIDHGDNVSTIYAHLSRIFVYKGQKVKIGDVIGKMGNTGWSTGPHLHFQINIYGIPINPRVFLDSKDSDIIN